MVAESTKKMALKASQEESKSVLSGMTVLCNVLESLIASQKNTGELFWPANFESWFLKPIVEDVNSEFYASSLNVSQLMSVQKIVTKMQNYEIQQRKKCANIPIFDELGEVPAAQQSFAESIVVGAFEEILDDIDSLEVEDVIGHLEVLAGLLTHDGPKDFSSSRSSVLSVLYKFGLAISEFEKFQVPAVQNLLIRFLFDYGMAQANVSGVISALTYAMTLPSDFPVDVERFKSVVEATELVGSEFAVFRDSGKILAFETLENNDGFLVLTEKRGLFALDNNKQPKPISNITGFEQDVRICHWKGICYILCQSVNKLWMVNMTNNTVEETTLNDKVSDDLPILSCGVLYGRIAVAQGQGSVINVNVYENGLSSEFVTTVIEVERFGLVVISEDLLRIQIEPSTAVVYDVNEHMEMEFLYKAVIDVSMINGDVLEIVNGKLIQAFHLRGDDWVLLATEGVYTPEYAKNPIHVSSVYVPLAEAINLERIITSVSNSFNKRLGTIVDAIVSKETKSSEDITHFVTDETISSSIKLIQCALKADFYSTDVRISLLCAGLRLLTINFCAYARNYDIEFLSDMSVKKVAAVRDVLRETVASPLSGVNCVMESICIFISLAFRHLFYPNYGHLQDLIELISRNAASLTFFVRNMSLLGNSGAILYCFTPTVLEFMKEWLTDDCVFEMISMVVPQIAGELRLLESISQQSNEKYIKTYFEVALEHAKYHVGEPQYVRFCVQIMLELLNLGHYPMIASAVVEKGIPIMREIVPYLETCTVDPRKIETPHNCPQGFEMNQEIYFPDAKRFCIRFARECHTKFECDYCTLYDRWGNVINRFSGSKANWPVLYELSTDYVRFHFKCVSDEPHWGFSAVCDGVSTLSPLPTIKLNDLLLRICCYTLGRLFETGMKSFPIAQMEDEWRLILESDLLDGVAPAWIYTGERDDSHHVPVVHPENESSWGHRDSQPRVGSLKGSLSRGLSYDADAVDEQYSDDMKKGFLRDLINPEEDGMGRKFLDFMYASIKYIHGRKISPQLAEIERYMAAGFLKQLGFVNIAITFAMNMAWNELEPSVSAVPANLTTLWRNIYKTRTLIIKARQQSIRKYENDPEAAQADYTAFLEDIKLKLKFLLSSDPIMKKKMSNAEALNPDTVEKTMKELCSFVTSEIRMADIKKMIQLRTSRMRLRLDTLTELLDLLGNSFLPYRAEHTLLMPLDRIMSVLGNTDDVQSVRHKMIDQLGESYSMLLEILVDRIVDRSTECLHRLLLIKMVANPLSSVVHPESLRLAFQKFASFVALKPLEDLKMFSAFSSIWRLMGLWTLQAPSPEIAETLLFMAHDNKLESCQHKSILLLSVLSQNCVESPCTLDDVCACFPDASPRVVIASFNWMAQMIQRSDKKGDKMIFKIRDMNLNLRELLLMMLNGIGSAAAGKSCMFLEEDAMPESHLAVMNEMVSMIRLLLRPFSKVHQYVLSVLHGVFSSYKEANFDKTDLSALSGVLAVLGKAVGPFQDYGYIMHLSRSINELTKIVSYDEVSGQIRTADFTGAVTKQSHESFIPSARICVNPNDFTLLKSEAKLLLRIHSWARSHMHNITLERAAFVAHFYGFLAIGLQCLPSMTNFISSVSLEDFIDLATTSTHDKCFRTFPDLVHKVGKGIVNIVSLKRQLTISPQETTDLPYSIAFHYSSPVRFLKLAQGQVSGPRIDTPADQLGLFIADIPVPNRAMIYYEITVLSHEDTNFYIGFIDRQSYVRREGVPGGNSPFLFYGYDFAESKPICPYLKYQHKDDITIKDGDVIGCGYTKTMIVFYLNGVTIEQTVPNPNVENVIPAVLTRCKVSFTYNFGKEPFVCDIINQPEFDIIADSMKTMPVPCPTNNPERPSDLDVNFTNDLLNSTRPNWETTRNRDPQRMFSQTIKPIVRNRRLKDVAIEYKTHEWMLEGQKYFIGQPVVLGKHIVDKRLTCKLPPHLRRRMYKVGTIRSLNGQTLTLQIKESWLNSVYICDVDYRLVSPVGPRFSEVCMALINNTRYTESEIDQYTAANHMKYESQRLNFFVKGYCIRMARYLFFSVMDYYRTTDQLVEFFKMPKVPVLMSLMLHEVFKTYNHTKVNPAWNNINASDYIFGEVRGNVQVTDVMFKCPGDCGSFARYFRAVCVSHPKDMAVLFEDLLVNSMDRLANERLNRPGDVYMKIEKHLQFESPHPCPDIDLNFSPTLDNEMIGFIPVLAPGHDIERSIYCSGNLLKDPVADCSFIPSKNPVIQIQETSSSRYGLKWGLLPIPEYLYEWLAETTMGNIQLIFVILSLVFSINGYENMFAFLKRHFFLSIVAALDHGNFFADIFSFDIMAPILTQIKWNPEDVTPEVESAFGKLKIRYAGSIKGWEPLSGKIQQGLLMTVFTNVLMLNRSSSGISAKSSEEEIGELYDKYMEARIGKASPEMVFERMTEAVTLCIALGFNLPIPVRFPTFILADLWTSCLMEPGAKRSARQKRELFIRKYDEFRKHAAYMERHWKVRYDEALGKIVRFGKGIYKQNPLETESLQFSSEPILLSLPRQIVYCRLQLFRLLDGYVDDMAKIVELGNNDSLLGSLFNACRAAISTDFKLKAVENVVLADVDDSTTHICLKFNRFKAQLFYSNRTNPNGRSLLAQLVDQVDEDREKICRMKRTTVPWHVDLIGEGATDAGGPGRDLFTEACMEIMHPAMDLFIPSPNQRNGDGANQELLIPHSRPVGLESFREKLYFVSGILMAAAYISKLPEPFKFARFVWNALTGRHVTIEDIYDVDQEFHQLMKSLENCDKTVTNEAEFASMFPYHFVVQDSRGEMVELVPGGLNIPVTYERRMEYVQRSKRFRLKEFNTQLEALRKGFNFFFDSSVASILSPWELELLTCGDNQCPVSELKKHCIFDNNDEHVQRLWKVLEEFTPEERMLFIKFGCGRMGLPPPGMSWSSKMQIQFRSTDSRPDAAKPLPTAATCSSTMSIPRYATDEWMARKLRAAITCAADIEQDHQAIVSDLVEVT